MTEQMRRALRNVVQRFTSDFWPPSSFLDREGERVTARYRRSASCDKRSRAHSRTHQTDSAHPGQHGGTRPAARVQTLLAEEEVKLGVVLFCTVRDLLDLHKHRLWRARNPRPKQKRQSRAKCLSNESGGCGTCNQSYLPPHTHTHLPLSHLESYCSVLMAVLPPMVLNRAASVLMKSIWTPAYRFPSAEGGSVRGNGGSG